MLRTPTRLQNEAGTRTEPPQSVPIPTVAKLAATDAPVPVSQGLFSYGIVTGAYNLIFTGSPTMPTIDTFGYNGTVPGPLIRVREGRQVAIDIRNDSDVDDIIHWHGLYVPALSDGAMEEGSPMIGRDCSDVRLTRW